jgi:hypothetical protein
MCQLVWAHRVRRVKIISKLRFIQIWHIFLFVRKRVGPYVAQHMCRYLWLTCVWNKLWTVTTRQLHSVDVNSSRSFMNDNERITGEDTPFLAFFRTKIFVRVRKIEKKSSAVLYSSCRPDRLEELSSHWTDFRDIWYLCIFRKAVEKIQVSRKSEKNNTKTSIHLW